MPRWQIHGTRHTRRRRRTRPRFRPRSRHRPARTRLSFTAYSGTVSTMTAVAARRRFQRSPASSVTARSSRIGSQRRRRSRVRHLDRGRRTVTAHGPTVGPPSRLRSRPAPGGCRAAGGPADSPRHPAHDRTPTRGTGTETVPRPPSTARCIRGACRCGTARGSRHLRAGRDRTCPPGTPVTLPGSKASSGPASTIGNASAGTGRGGRRNSNPSQRYSASATPPSASHILPRKSGLDGWAVRSLRSSRATCQGPCPVPRNQTPGRLSGPRTPL